MRKSGSLAAGAAIVKICYIQSVCVSLSLFILTKLSQSGMVPLPPPTPQTQIQNATSQNKCPSMYDLAALFGRCVATSLNLRIHENTTYKYIN